MNRIALAAVTAVGISAVILAPHAHAQLPNLGGNQTGQTTTGGLMGGMAGMAGIPSVGSASTGNIAGILDYCLSQNAVSSSSGHSVVSSLTSQGNVAASSDYQKGLDGSLQTGSGKSIGLSSLSQPLKQRVCSAALKRGQALIN